MSVLDMTTHEWNIIKKYLICDVYARVLKLGQSTYIVIIALSYCDACMPVVKSKQMTWTCMACHTSSSCKNMIACDKCDHWYHW